MSFEPYLVNGVAVTLYYRTAGGPVWYNFRVRGDRWRNSTKVYTERDARIVVREIVLKALENAHAPAQTALWTVKDAVREYMRGRFGEVPNTKHRTYQDAKSRLGKLVALFGEQSFPSAPADARALMQRYLDTRKHLAPLTVISDHRVISRFYSWLKSRKYMNWDFNPAFRAELPKAETPDPEPLADDEIEILLATAPLTTVWPLVVLGLGVGTRPHEGYYMEWARDVNFDTGVVRAVNQKSSKSRYCTMNSWVRRELKQWREKHKDDVKVWPHSRTCANEQMQMIRERVWLAEHVTLQGLRRTACTRAILSGMELADYTRHFGHRLEVAQRHYLKLGIVERKEKLECLAFG